MRETAHQAFIREPREQLGPDAGGPERAAEQDGLLRELERKFDALFANLEEED